MEKLNRSAARTGQSLSVVSFSEDAAQALRQRFPDAFHSDPPMLRGAVIAQWKRHQGTNCACQAGRLHGPYHYLFQMEPGRRLRKRYIRIADVPHVRALVQRHQAVQAQKRNSRREWTETFQNIKRNLRETDRMLRDYK